MRKKQARPAKRITGGVLAEEEDDSAENSRELISPGLHSPSISPPPLHHSILSTGKSGDSTAENSFCASALSLQDAPYILHNNNTPPLKTPKYEPDDSGKCCTAECASFSRSQFAHHKSPNGHNSSRIPTSCHVPIISAINDNHQKSCLSLFTASKSNFDISSAKASRIDASSIAISADSESPLKRLERCVRANSSKEGGANFGFCRNSKPFASKYYLTESRSNTDSIKLRFGHDSTKTSAADALDELSQLVHRIGTAKLPMPVAPNKCVSNSITSNIFTCLKCAQRFDTLDELVLHISTTKHFTRGATKNLDAVAPWERDRATANFEKQVASSNFLAPLFYAHKYLEVPQNLSQESIDSNF